MPTQPLTDAQILETIAVWRKTQRPDRPAGDMARTAKLMGLSSNAVTNRIYHAVCRGLIPLDKHVPAGIASRFDGFLTPVAAQAPAPVVTEEISPVEEHALKRQNAELKRQLEAAYGQISGFQSIRGELFKLGPAKAARFSVPASVGNKSRHTAGLMISDVHGGEYVSLAEMDGLNSYDLEIMERRLNKTFDAFASLSKRWVGDSLEALVVKLGGDMVSGALHDDHKRTDLLRPIPAAKRVGEVLAGGLNHLSSTLGLPIKVYTVVGNHGRTTGKPESKGHVGDNLDTLTSYFAEAAVNDKSAVRFFYSDSIDAQFSIYGRHQLLTHGDRMGSKGGMGQIGPIAPIARGHKRLKSDYVTRGVNIDTVYSAHFHMACQTEDGFGNGSLIGPSQYGRDFRFSAKPCSQRMTIHNSGRGIVLAPEIFPGSPEEGSIYQ